MISENVRKWKTHDDKRFSIEEFDSNIEMPVSYSDNIDYYLEVEKVEKLEQIIGSDEDCYMLLHGLLEMKTYEEICVLIGCQKKKLYKIIEKLRKFIKIRDEP